ncbi:hypothetical protein GJ698_00340 [Pseudoduganella sp. FT26W]|uniref:Uncharacterized protein n=1 Tax=Duganella aquatilis TaxID=2666082 RepID=A0A844CPB4_9BURK|nr:hypothetical protein [Duganella aquatilis]MRW82537.1 hypothetical protein [Duganella aquatilis]
MSENIYLLTLLMPLGTIFLIFFLRSRTAIRKAQLEAEGNEAYRLLAERAVAVQEQNAAALADLKARIAAIETILKQVE